MGTCSLPNHSHASAQGHAAGGAGRRGAGWTPRWWWRGDALLAGGPARWRDGDGLLIGGSARRRDDGLCIGPAALPVLRRRHYQIRSDGGTQHDEGDEQTEPGAGNNRHDTAGQSDGYREGDVEREMSGDRRGETGNQPKQNAHSRAALVVGLATDERLVRPGVGKESTVLHRALA